MKFKIGDRVRVYQEMAPVVGLVKEAGEIHPSYLSVEVRGKIIRPHRKQCRRIKSKKWREWWIGIPKNLGCYTSVFGKDPQLFSPPMFETADYSEIIHVREVRK